MRTLVVLGLIAVVAYFVWKQRGGGSLFGSLQASAQRQPAGVVPVSYAPATAGAAGPAVAARSGRGAF